MKTIQTLSLLFVATIGGKIIQAQNRTPVEFFVHNTEGQPVTGAFVEASLPGPGNASGKTDNTGRLILNLSQTQTLSVDVRHPDYYSTAGQIWRGGRYLNEAGQLVPRLIPHRFDIVLKQVINPVLMIRKTFMGHVPAVEGPVGFDLDAGDWIRPYGTGQRTDLYFAFDAIHVQSDGFSATLHLSFPSETDGIKPFHAAREASMEFGSNHAPPHSAPVNGYSPALKKSIRYQRGDVLESDHGSDRKFIFRVRSKCDASGQIYQACYGWIEGEIEFDPRDRKGIQLAFTYSLNPDPSPGARSLERLGKYR